MITEERVGHEPPRGDPLRHSRGPLGPFQWAALVLALCALSGLVGWWIAQPDDRDPGRVDVGFYDDMIVHHQQAVVMGFAEVERGSDPTFTHIAREIVIDQSLEINAMDSQLVNWGHLESTPGAMGWMGMGVPDAGMMPGMASTEDVEQLQRAQGAEADEIFGRLMILHHWGGIHMARFAAEHADTPVVRRYASAMARTQRAEVLELNHRRAQLGLDTVPRPDFVAAEGHGVHH